MKKKKTAENLIEWMHFIGFIVAAYAVYQIWQARDIWPRALGDPIPHDLIVDAVLFFGGLFLLSVFRRD